MTKALQAPPGYALLLKDIKERVRTAQVRAALAVNQELKDQHETKKEHMGTLRWCSSPWLKESHTIASRLSGVSPNRQGFGDTKGHT